MTDLEEADRLPPFVCRLLARDGRHHRAYSTKELVQRSGLNEKTIRRLARMDSWAKVLVGVRSRFREACGINRGNENYQLKFLKMTAKSKQPFLHLLSLERRELSTLRKIIRSK